MLKFDDYVRILQFIKDGTYDEKLDAIWRTLAQSEQQVSLQFFQNTIDQTAFATDDYKRLRKFLIDWYAAFRTISKQQQGANDAFSLPDNHLSEMMRSFGYTVGLDIVPLENKANFFLDLVNFYKKKGTVETVIDILDYYGFTDADIVEYWLVKNSSGDLVFRPQTVRKSSVSSTVLLLNDFQYDAMTATDPHWMYTESQIENLITTNKINLPSKSPYFSFSSAFRLQEMNAVMALTSRIVRDQYADWLAGDPLPVHTSVYRIGTPASLLEVYLATIYMFEQMHGTWASTNSDLRYWLYTGTVNYTTTTPKLPVDLDIIYQDFQNLLDPKPQTRAEIAALEATILADWTDDQANNILDVTQEMAGPMLQSLGSELWDVCQTYLLQGQGELLLNYLLITIGRWMKTNINTRVPNLVVTTLGFSFKQEIIKIINFFKPFRARFSFFDGVFINEDFVKIEDEDPYLTLSTSIIEQPQGGGIPCTTYDGARVTYDCPNGTHDVGIVDDEVFEYIDLNPLTTDQIYITDYLNTILIQKEYHFPLNLTDELAIQYELTFVDFFSADSTPCGAYEDARSLYDCGSYHDISVDDQCDMVIASQLHDRMNDHVASLGEGIDEGVTFDSTANVIAAFQAGGVFDMDEGWSFDNQHGTDVCQITVTTI